MTDQPRTCWRSECRERCAYHGLCQPLPRADQPSTPAPNCGGALTDDERVKPCITKSPHSPHQWAGFPPDVWSCPGTLRLRLTEAEAALLAEAFGGASPSPLLTNRVERILSARAAWPGTPTAVEALADQIAAHDAYRVNDDGWTVCICGHVAEGDDDDGSHARHVAAALAQVEAQPNEEELA
jgi:hypothetical protein